MSCDGNEFKSQEETQKLMMELERNQEGDSNSKNYDGNHNSYPKIKETFLNSLKNYFYPFNKGSHSSFQQLSSRRRHRYREEEIFTTIESGAPTIADISLPIFISTSCEQVHHPSADNILSYVNLKDPKTNYVLQKAHYFAPNLHSRDYNEDTFTKRLSKYYEYSNEQLPCLQILSNNVSSSKPTLHHLVHEIDQKVVENKYYTDDGNICVSPNVANCNRQNCFPYETKFESDFDVRYL